MMMLFDYEKPKKHEYKKEAASKVIGHCERNTFAESFTKGFGHW